MKRKVMITVLSAAVMLAFAGCSGNDKDTGDKSAEKKTQDTQEEDSAEEKEPGAAGGNRSDVLTTAETLVKDLIEGKDRKSTRLNSSHPLSSRMPSSA